VTERHNSSFPTTLHCHGNKLEYIPTTLFFSFALHYFSKIICFVIDMFSSQRTDLVESLGEECHELNKQQTCNNVNLFDMSQN